jgi:hypothetical protein
MASVAARPTKTDWAEDEELEGTFLIHTIKCRNELLLMKIAELPAPAETTDASTGITTIISYKKDEHGKTIKVSRDESVYGSVA